MSSQQDDSGLKLVDSKAKKSAKDKRLDGDGGDGEKGGGDGKKGSKTADRDREKKLQVAPPDLDDFPVLPGPKAAAHMSGASRYVITSGNSKNRRPVVSTTSKGGRRRTDTPAASGSALELPCHSLDIENARVKDVSSKPELKENDTTRHKRTGSSKSKAAPKDAEASITTGPTADNGLVPSISTSAPQTGPINRQSAADEGSHTPLVVFGSGIQYHSPYQQARTERQLKDKRSHQDTKKAESRDASEQIPSDTDQSKCRTCGQRGHRAHNCTRSLPDYAVDTDRCDDNVDLYGVHISCIPYWIVQDDLFIPFERYGQLMYWNWNREKGWACVRYATEEARDKAIEECHGLLFGGDRIHVIEEQPNMTYPTSKTGADFACEGPPSATEVSKLIQISKSEVDIRGRPLDTIHSLLHQNSSLLANALAKSDVCEGLAAWFKNKKISNNHPRHRKFIGYAGILLIHLPKNLIDEDAHRLATLFNPSGKLTQLWYDPFDNRPFARIRFRTIDDAMLVFMKILVGNFSLLGSKLVPKVDLTAKQYGHPASVAQIPGPQLALSLAGMAPYPTAAPRVPPPSTVYAQCWRSVRIDLGQKLPRDQVLRRFESMRDDIERIDFGLPLSGLMLCRTLLSAHRAVEKLHRPAYGPTKLFLRPPQISLVFCEISGVVGDVQSSGILAPGRTLISRYPTLEISSIHPETGQIAIHDTVSKFNPVNAGLAIQVDPDGPLGSQMA